MNSQCIRVKEFLNFTGAEFEEVNIDEQDVDQELKDLIGQVEAPVTRIGEKFVEGFDKEALLELVENSGIETDMEDQKPV